MRARLLLSASWHSSPALRCLPRPRAQGTRRYLNIACSAERFLPGVVTPTPGKPVKPTTFAWVPAENPRRLETNLVNSTWSAAGPKLVVPTTKGGRSKVRLEKERLPHCPRSTAAGSMVRLLHRLHCVLLNLRRNSNADCTGHLWQDAAEDPNSRGRRHMRHISRWLHGPYTVATGQQRPGIRPRDWFPTSCGSPSPACRYRTGWTRWVAVASPLGADAAQQAGYSDLVPPTARRHRLRSGRSL